MSVERKRVRVEGIVQGVGFRPFVYGLAVRLELMGWVCNDLRGVSLEVQGLSQQVGRFVIELRNSAPPRSRIDTISVDEISLREAGPFRILPSPAGEPGLPPSVTSVSPDLSLCSDCRREMFDPEDRRYLYPFINCTNCGPRFSIVLGIPYDRPLTTMAGFEMCPECLEEYEDPSDRRYHAQPIACPICGPKLAFHDASGQAQAADPVVAAHEILLQGEILAIKGIGGFHLACDATREEAVQRSRDRKRRPRRPLAVMVPSLEYARREFFLGPCEEETLSGVERPIVLLRRREGGGMAQSVAPGLSEVGVMLPYTPMHELLFNPRSDGARSERQSALPPLVMTSGNLSDEPLCIQNEEAMERLGGIADGFLLHNRDIARPCDDSVVRVWRERIRFIRRSRGYVPRDVPLPGVSHAAQSVPSILTLGGDLKNTCCLTRETQAVLSQHLGDLELTVSQEHATRSREDLRNLLAVTPEIVGGDSHPGYVSRRMADEAAESLGERDLHRVDVQHHHAHMAACLAEHGHPGEALALVWDGTGYGLDGAIWGGEILLGDLTSFQRVGGLEPIPLVGGDRAVKEPWRLALAWVQRAMPDEMPKITDRLFCDVPAERLALVAEALQKVSHSAICCSMGRLFDAVSVLAGWPVCVSYEGEAAMLLEEAARGVTPVDPYPIPLVKQNGMLVWQLQPLMRKVIEDRFAERDRCEIAGAFHEALIHAARESLKRISEETGLKSVALSGGCFQNTLLLESLTARLEADGFQVLVHERVPCTDGGIAYGQAAVIARRALDG